MRSTGKCRHEALATASVPCSAILKPHDETKYWSQHNVDYKNNTTYEDATTSTGYYNMFGKGYSSLDSHKNNLRAVQAFHPMSFRCLVINKSRDFHRAIQLPRVIPPKISRYTVPRFYRVYQPMNHKVCPERLHTFPFEMAIISRDPLYSEIGSCPFKIASTLLATVTAWD